MEKNIKFLQKVMQNDALRVSTSPDVLLFIACQFALESNFGNSNLANRYCNFCGMKIPKLRPTFAIYDGDGFAEFDDLDSCVLDYVIWLSWNHFTQSDLDDLKFFKERLIKSHYCDDADYISSIERLFNQYNSIINY